MAQITVAPVLRASSASSVPSASALAPSSRAVGSSATITCVLAAIAHQDRFFADDPWYATRRHAALLVGLNCRTACAN